MYGCYFCNFTNSSTSPWVLFTFLKLQMVPDRVKYHIESDNAEAENKSRKGPRLPGFRFLCLLSHCVQQFIQTNHTMFTQAIFMACNGLLTPQQIYSPPNR